MERNHQCPHRDIRPGLWNETLWQWPASRGALTPQAPQPAQAQHPQAAPSAWPRHGGAQQEPQIGPGRGLGSRTDFQGSTHTDHPQGRDSQGPPEARGPVGRAPLGLLPLPAAALHTRAALFTPPPPPLPGGVAALWRQVCQQTPRVRVALAPPRHQGTIEPALRRDAGGAPTAPALPHVAHQLAEPLPPCRPSRPNFRALGAPQEGMPPQADQAAA
jgi:hypothetical protein